MRMDYKKFHRMISLLSDHENKTSKLYDFIRPEIFDELHKVIYELLKLSYSTSSIDYVLYPYIYENDRNPATIDGKEYPMSNIKELYTLMELLNEDYNGEEIIKEELDSMKNLREVFNGCN